MRLRIKVRQQSGERDSTFTTTFDGVKYTVGPKPVEVPEAAGKYIIGSFSDFIEVAPEPVPVVEVVPPVTLKPKRVRKPKASVPKANRKKK